jgi:hypothetical protein
VDDPAPYGYWAACTPHWDQVADCGIFSGHYVPEVWAGHGNEGEWGNWGGSGFDAARDWLWWQLTQVEGHQSLGWMDYGNTQALRQCNGEWTALDGKVNIIRLD